ncbi:PACE efflux transporter [Pseudomonas fulva]|uniref:PACE efflux transporter n=1 Tax=Pseudomonas fulva TaxID=47880 RepID=UPI0018AA1196|nr:PACE efflux transporter [Pseudomonas fulva]MBF8775603.1 PACE efflux transporter [Pseudomonas fulva]
MQGLKRKLVYVTFYELIGLCMSTLGLAYLSDTQASHTGPLAVMITTIAMIWNLIYNTVFEYWESRQATRGRSVARRVVHAVGFQLTLVIYLIPLIAWWLDMSLVDALWVDMAFIVLVPCYTFVYNWAFDKLFGLPSSAMAAT